MILFSSARLIPASLTSWVFRGRAFVRRAPADDDEKLLPMQRVAGDILTASVALRAL